MKDIYLWSNKLPSGFNGHSNPIGAMVDIRQYSLEPGFTDPVDRWSFGVKQSEWDKLGAGASSNLGMAVSFNTTTDLRVSHVEPASAAGGADIKRGWRITSIDNNSNISTNPADVDRITKAMYASRATIGFSREGMSDTTIKLNAINYEIKPVYLDTVYTLGDKKIGYLVFTSFLGNMDATKSEFNTVFAGFSSQNINDLIIDLRYNGGGYVALASELLNYVAPASVGNGLMYKQQHNEKYSATKDTTVYFSKKGSLNLERIIFITTNQTASSSELVINALKPYMKVVQVGRATNGKAIGFFPIPVADWYMFPTSFRVVNKNGEGNYFSGLQPDKNIGDDLTKDWGNIEEGCLANSLYYAYYGSFRRAGQDRQNEEIENGNRSLNRHNFAGMVGTRHEN